MDWQTDKILVAYEDALAVMEDRVTGIRSGDQSELVWLLEHPSLYTGGTSAKATDLLSQDLPVFQTGRGGQYTYHGPGQRVGYVMLDLKKRQRVPDIKKYVWQLEQWIIDALSVFDVIGERREGRVGIWVMRDDGREDKIAALGVRVRHWVTFHGIAINVNPDLEYYKGIVPCGIQGHGVTSLHDLGRNVTMDELDDVLKQTFSLVFD